jgi:triacylglycerol lipase
MQVPSRLSRIASRTVLAAMVGVTMLSPGASQAVGATVRPVLLVHGFEGSSSAFDTMAARLARGGREVYAIALPGQDNIINAKAIRAFVAANRLGRVDIVAHSMGGLSSRWFVKFLRGSVSVAHYVSLGTPQYGLWGTCPAPLDYGGQMCPDGAFLGKLNSGDDTPGPTRYTSVFSTDDGLVPVSSSRLDGGACLIRDGGVTHGQLLTDTRVYRQIVYSLNGRCPTAFD